MSTVKDPLKYLWEALFADGTIIKQPADDRYSKHDDKAEHNPSAFRDVLEKEEDSQLVAFILTPEAGDPVGIMLPTAEFCVNTTVFTMHDQNYTPKKPKLIFFREVRQDTVGGVTQPAYVNRYFLGWQEEGDNSVKYVMGIE